ncbi:MAG: YidC/Oxa1 family membrane protein insertase [Candidatus Komeilibacteria bacterium]|nr:YidC/Oxa1 family membrane protein insertase [Candidatus Komeilibacteria bacterium]
MFSALYYNILYEPIFNILIFFYNLIPLKDIGFAIIALTIVIRLILYPLSKSSIESQKKLQTLKPQIDELKEKHKDNKEAFGRATMELYKKHKINPASSCLPLLIQFPVLIAVYQVFRNELATQHYDLLYSFIPAPESLNQVFLGVVDLSQPNIPLAVVTGAAQFFQTKMIMAKNATPKPDNNAKKGQFGDIAGAMNKQMLYVMPVLTVFIGASLPSGLVLYWLASTVLTILQQYIIFRKKSNHIEPQVVE